MKRDAVVLVNVVMALVLVGVLMVYSAGTVRGYQANSDAMGHTFRYLWGQVLRVGIGLTLLFLAARFDYHNYRKRKVLWGIGLATIFLLVIVLILGEEVNGARRWIRIFGFSIQPSDFARIAVVILLAVKLSENQDLIRSLWRGFVPPLMLAGFFAGLIILEPDIGTPFVLGCTALTMALMAGAKVWHFILAIGPAAAIGLTYIQLNPHAYRRVYSFRNPVEYRLDEGWQLLQSLWAFARGGIFGQGPGAGQQKLHYLPEAHSDFIFAVLGEEWGLVGTLAVATLFVVFVVIALRIAVCAPDLLGSLLAGGIATIIALQAALNMGVTTGLLPTKGLTLPFISAGGTALIVYLAMIGVLLNVAGQAVERDPAPKRVAASA